MRTSRIVLSCASVLAADALFFIRMGILDDVHGLPLALIIIGMAVASVFLIYNYCFSTRAGESIYLLQIVSYVAFSIIFMLHQIIGNMALLLVTAAYIAFLFVLFIRN